jgi:hypothetical protein
MRNGITPKEIGNNKDKETRKMNETNMTIEANNMEDAFKALAYARRHSKANNLRTNMVPHLYGTNVFGQSFTPYIESVSVMKEIIRSYYASVNSYSQYEWVKDFTLTTTFECWNFGISITFTENRTDHEEE